MITSFIDSWSLFHDAYLVGWLIAVMLSSIGVVVAARDQIFLGAAVSQASLLGIALGMVSAATVLQDLPWSQSEHFPSFVGGACAVIGSLLTARSGPARGQSYEATTGWLFLFSSSTAILLVSHSPHGLEEVHRLLSSTLIGATHHDTEIFALLCLVTLLAIGFSLRPLCLLIMDEEMAAAVGVPVVRWNRLISIWLGLGIGLSIRISGMLFSFGLLVLPALLARQFCREVRSMFLVAPVIALISSATAFVVANFYDLPPGQVAVALLGGVLAVVWSARRVTRG